MSSREASNFIEFEAPPSSSICFLAESLTYRICIVLTSKLLHSSTSWEVCPACSNKRLAGVTDLANAFLGRGLQNVHDTHELTKEVVPHHASASQLKQNTEY